MLLNSFRPGALADLDSVIVSGKDNQKVIIDYEDKKIAFLERQFKQRKRYYNKLTKP
jgi:hypothetical protein